MSRPLLALICIVFALGGCHSKHSSGTALGTAPDLNGYWKVYTTESGQPEYGPAALFLAVSGSAIAGVDLDGTATGSVFDFTATVGNNKLTVVTGVLTSAITASGTFTVTQGGGTTASGTFRMVKFTPTGTFRVSGSIFGQDVTHNATAAVGSRKYDDAGLSQINEVEVMSDGTALNFELDFEPANLALGTLSIGTATNQVGVAVEFSTGTFAARALGIAGSISVTKLDDSGFSGTFTIDLDSGDRITGTIDVQFDIEAFLPPNP